MNLQFNFVAILVAALVAMPVGFIWYNPKVFGNAWMKEINQTQDDLKKGPNMAILFGSSLLFAFMIAIMMNTIAIHQNGIFSTLAGIAGIKESKVDVIVNGASIDYLNVFRTFKHGAFHGLLASIFFALPIIAQAAMYERRSFKYVAITTGYWIVTLILMGGIIGAWK